MCGQEGVGRTRLMVMLKQPVRVVSAGRELTVQLRISCLPALTCMSHTRSQQLLLLPLLRLLRCNLARHSAR